MGSLELWKTHRTLVGLLSGVDSHVDKQFIAGVEWLVPSRTPCPEASEVFPFALIYVNLLDVPYKFLLLVIQSAAVNPTTAVLAPDIVQLPILFQDGLGQSQRLRVGGELLVGQVRMGVVGGWGALGRWLQRWRRGQV